MHGRLLSRFLFNDVDDPERLDCIEQMSLKVAKRNPGFLMIMTNSQDMEDHCLPVQWIEMLVS